MPIYDKPTKELMKEFVAQEIKLGQVFSKNDAARWFTTHYPDIKSNTVKMHVDGMSINSPLRKHHPSIKAGSGHDLFLKLGPDQFRLWEPKTDPTPLYRDDLIAGEGGSIDSEDDVDGENTHPGSTSFAYERDLREYLARSLAIIEPGLRLYEDDDITGVEFPAGGRFIDILAVDKDENFVVIELKVSKGYDRVIGQILRYMAWVDTNLAEGKKTRGYIIAREISDDLKMAVSRISDVRLAEYELAVSINTLS
jgi:endonuclease